MSRFVRPLLVVATLTLALSACAPPRERISSTLQTYGVDKHRADCAGDYLERHLTINQLMHLSDAAKAYTRSGHDPAHLTFGDLLRVSHALNDIEIPVQVGAAAVSCSIAPDVPLSRLWGVLNDASRK
jgi:hypothetical protein